MSSKKKGKKKSKASLIIFIIEMVALLVLAAGIFMYARINSGLEGLGRTNASARMATANGTVTAAQTANATAAVGTQSTAAEAVQAAPAQAQAVARTTPDPNFDADAAEENQGVSTLASLKGYTNIALVGIDTRDSDEIDYANSDTMIIASINNDTGKIRMVSLYRDTLLNIGNSKTVAQGDSDEDVAYDTVEDNSGDIVDDYAGGDDGGDAGYDDGGDTGYDDGGDTGYDGGGETYDNGGDNGSAENYDNGGDNGSTENYDNGGDNGSAENYDNGGDNGSTENYDNGGDNGSNGNYDNGGNNGSNGSYDNGGDNGSNGNYDNGGDNGSNGSASNYDNGTDISNDGGSTTTTDGSDYGTVSVQEEADDYGYANNDEFSVSDSALDSVGYQLGETYADGSYNKANAAYMRGSAKQFLSMLNKNLDLNIHDYVVVDFDAVAVLVEDLGGIEVWMTKQEVIHMNNYCVETSNATGMDYTPITPSEEAANYHLNGVQAVSYARIRYTTGNDMKRTQRQRVVINKVVDKIKSNGLQSVNALITDVFPYVKTSLSAAEIIQMATGMFNYSIDKTTGFPFTHLEKDVYVGSSKLDCVVPVTLEENVKQLHEFLFDDMNYEVSSEVKLYSEDIETLSGLTEANKELAEKNSVIGKSGGEADIVR